MPQCRLHNRERRADDYKSCLHEPEEDQENAERMYTYLLKPAAAGSNSGVEKCYTTESSNLNTTKGRAELSAICKPRIADLSKARSGGSLSKTVVPRSESAICQDDRLNRQSPADMNQYERSSLPGTLREKSNMKGPTTA